MIELEHSPLGGSGAHRFLACEGSFFEHREQLQTGTFENIESEFAKLGTAAHEAGAVCLATDIEPFELLGEKFGDYIVGWPGGINLDALQVYVNDCRSIMERCGYDGLAIVERTYHMPDIHPLLKGTVDFAYLSPSQGVFLRDYKNGEGVGVAPHNNPQLLYYAFLLVVSMRPVDVDTPVNLGIVQPNFYGVFEEPDVWITTVGFVLDWGYETLLPAMKHLSTNSVAKEFWNFVPGDHCQFCPVILDCPKMQSAFADYVDGSEDFVTMLTNEEVSDLYGKREYARRFMKALEDVARARMLTKPGSITTAKLVEKQEARVWKPGASAALVEVFGEKAYKPKEILSPAQVEKLSSRGKELALEYGFKPSNGALTIAPLSDRRAEAKPRNNETVFAHHAVDPVEAGW